MNALKRPTLGFVGAGVVGRALSVALTRRGYRVVAAFSRTKASAERLAAGLRSCSVRSTAQEVADDADLIFLTLPDDAIEAVAASIRWQREKIAIHCSGAGSMDLLDAAHKQGARVGTLHPLQTFANEEQAEHDVAGSTFALEASDDALLGELQRMTDALEGRAVILRGENKALYHASAVIASNYLVTLLDVASELWNPLNVPKAEALSALLPLVQGTVSNLEAAGLPKALTGPIARGDTGTIQRNLIALENVSPEAAALYRALGRRAIPIALAKGGIDGTTAERIRGLLDRESRQNE
jgi:predicted short-subunit dehydrogenase-like oxidoreductase (DUF2520 family)